jgi:hypothetical protein
MKKMFLLIIATSAVIFASAQIQFGVKANYNLASVMHSGAGTSGDTYSGKSGFSGGVLALMPISGSLYLQPEIVYSGQGTNVSNSGESGSLNFNYLNIPVLAKYQSSSGFFGETGPQVGFVLSSNVKTQGVTVDFKDYTQSVDFSWAFGVGYKLQDMGLGFDIRYNLGLTNMVKNTEDVSYKNSVFQFGVFYLLNTGK